MKMEESNFIRLLGNSPTIKVLDFLLTFSDFDYSKKEIAENSGISYNTLNAIWQYLTANILVKTRRIGKQDMYKLDFKKEEVKELSKFYNSLLLNALNKMDEDAKTRLKAKN